jgi:hypothetical protein
MKESAWNDPIVEATRRVRQEIAAAFGDDIGALGEYFKAMRAADGRATACRVPAAGAKDGRPPAL